MLATAKQSDSLPVEIIVQLILILGLARVAGFVQTNRTTAGVW